MHIHLGVQFFPRPLGATFATVTGEGLFSFFAKTLVNGLFSLQLHLLL